MVWRDISDPRKAEWMDDLEAGLREPEYENIMIPEKFGPVSEIIDDHKIKRYAFEINDYMEWAMREGTNPFGKERIAHATLLTNDIVQLFTLGFKGSKVIGLHTIAELTFKAPARINEVVTLQGEYTEKFVKRGQGVVVLEADVKGEDGRTIVEYRGEEIMRTIPGEIAGRGTAEVTSERKVTGEIPENARVISKIDKETRIGDVFGPLEKEITAEQAAVFSRVGEFVINIHNNLEKAHEGNLRIPIVQGAQLYCTIGQLLSDVCGAELFTDGWLKAKFIAPVKVFEGFKVYGMVSSIEQLENGKKKYLMDVWIRRDSDQRLAVVGWASCVK